MASGSDEAPSLLSATEQERYPDDEDDEADASPPTPTRVKACFFAAYCAVWIFNAYAVWQWTADTIRIVLLVWIFLYSLDMIVSFRWGWSAAPWDAKELRVHHSISVVTLLIVVAMLPCMQQSLLVRIFGIWMLVNLNEAMFILTDVLGLSQHDSKLSIARRIFLPFHINLVVPAAVLFLDYYLPYEIMYVLLLDYQGGNDLTPLGHVEPPQPTATDRWCFTCSCSVLLVSNVCAWVYYPYLGFRCMRSLRQLTSA